MKKSILVNPDEIQLYIKDLRKIPVISHQRQEEIFNLMNDKKLDLTKRTSGLINIKRK